MDKIKVITTGVLFSLFDLAASSQNPDYVDPGNMRGDEGTAYLWENSEYYIPVLVVVIVLVAFRIRRKKKNSS